MRQLFAPELNGDWMYSVAVHNGRLVRENTHHHPRFLRVHARTHTDFRGVSVYDLFSARNFGNAVEPLNLDRAMAGDSLPAARFLLSITSDGGLAVITSRLGYDISRAVVVEPETQYAGVEEISMYDFAHSFSLADLTAQHLSRYATLTGVRPNSSINPYFRDGFFRETMISLPEEA